RPCPPTTLRRPRNSRDAVPALATRSSHASVISPVPPPRDQELIHARTPPFARDTRPRQRHRRAAPTGRWPVLLLPGPPGPDRHLAGGSRGPAHRPARGERQRQV